MSISISAGIGDFTCFVTFANPLFHYFFILWFLIQLIFLSTCILNAIASCLEVITK